MAKLMVDVDVSKAVEGIMAIRQATRGLGPDYEIRTVMGTVEIRGEGDEPRTLVGVSPPWDTLSTEGALPGFRETFERGAFTNLEDDILVTVEHDNGKILGRSSAGTARFSDTPEGLRYEADLPDTVAARDLEVSVERGDITGSSFEFLVHEDGDRWVEENGTVTRTVKKDGAAVRQAGPVSRPAYGDAPQVALRCEQKVAELTAPPVDTAKAERARQLREAELALAESGLGSGA